MTTDFVAVDWGTTSFRLWLLGCDGQVHGESRGPEGMSHCVSAGFAPVLAAHLSRLGSPDLPVLICGMAGARQGWVEVPYADLPAPVSSLAAGAVQVPLALRAESGLPVDIRILPGLAQRNPSRPDVMRGEETQLLGLAGDGITGLVCMPGTHCKWASLFAGAVTGFASFITGELFDLLTGQSILRHSMPESRKVSPEDADFLAAVDDALADPAALSAALFPLRAGHLLGLRDTAATLARLSGLLIGAEVGLQLRCADSRRVTLVGQEGLGALYATALRRAGADLQVVDAETASRRGLLVAAGEIWSF